MYKIARAISIDHSIAARLSDDILLECIDNDWHIIQYVPEKSFEFYLDAVKKCGSALKYIPEKFKTYELCLLAVQNHGGTLEYVPSQLKIKELCLEAIKDVYWAFRYIPSEYIDHDFCIEMLKINADILEYIPIQFVTEELCCVMIENNIKLPLKHIKDDQILTKLFKKNINHLGRINLDSNITNKLLRFLTEENNNMELEIKKLSERVRILEETVKYYPDGEEAIKLAKDFANNIEMIKKEKDVEKEKEKN